MSVIAVIGAFALGAPSKLAAEIRVDKNVHRALEDLLANPKVHGSLHCGTLTFPSFRLVPDARLILGNGQSIRGRGETPAPITGVAVTVKSSDRRVTARYSHPGIKLPIDERVPPGFTAIASSGPLSAWVLCPSPPLAGKG